MVTKSDFVKQTKKSPKAKLNTKIYNNLSALINQSSQDSNQEILRAFSKKMMTLANTKQDQNSL